jgi:hypothetical protein
MGITSDDGFIAQGAGGDEFGIPYPYRYLAADGGGKQWGVVTEYTEPDPGFVVGCMAIGREIGVQGWAGRLESGLAGNAYLGPGWSSGHAGPPENAYWDKACVVGWSPQFHRSGRDHHKSSTTWCLRAVRRCSGTSRGCQRRGVRRFESSRRRPRLVGDK